MTFESVRGQSPSRRDRSAGCAVGCSLVYSQEWTGVSSKKGVGLVAGGGESNSAGNFLAGGAGPRKPVFVFTGKQNHASPVFRCLASASAHEIAWLYGRNHRP